MIDIRKMLEKESYFIRLLSGGEVNEDRDHSTGKRRTVKLMVENNKDGVYAVRPGVSSNNPSFIAATIIRERYVPQIDRYIVNTLCSLSEHVKLERANLKPSTICEAIADGIRAFNKDAIPSTNRTLIIGAKAYRALRDAVGLTKATECDDMGKGYIGTYYGIPIVKASTLVLPKQVNFILIYKDCVSVGVCFENLLYQYDAIEDCHKYKFDLLYDCYKGEGQNNGIFVNFDAQEVFKEGSEQ